MTRSYFFFLKKVIHLAEPMIDICFSILAQLIKVVNKKPRCTNLLFHALTLFIVAAFQCISHFHQTGTRAIETKA